MEITIKKSFMIRPASHTPSQSLWCSSLDLQMMLWKHVDVAFFYKPNVSSNFFHPQLLKEALSNILVPFYPAAGRLGKDESGRIEIVCNAEGVSFIEAETSVVLDDYNLSSGGSCSKLVPPVDYSGNLSSYPLVLIQVTRFKCGGVCIGVKAHHVLVDAASSIYFISSWCDMVRVNAIAILPFIDRTIIKSLMPPAPTFHHIEYDPPPSMTMNESSSDITTTSIMSVKISKIQLNELRLRSQNINENVKYGTYSILAAHLWRCLTKARGLPNNQATMLRIPVDGRFKLKHPPLPSGYFGNVIVEASAIALAGDLLSEPFADTVARIHKAMQLDDAYMKSTITVLENQYAEPTFFERDKQTRKSPNVFINDWSRVPSKKMNFGWGAPTFTGLPRPARGLILMVQPNSTDNNEGGLTVVANLETSSIKLFLELVCRNLVPKL